MRRLIHLAAAGVFVAAVAATASAQDFQRSFQLPAGGRISVTNMSGDVIVTGYDGNEVVVVGTREGRDLDKVEIVDESTPNHIRIHPRYPDHCNCDASVRFEVRVPRSTSYDFEKIASMSGNVEVTNVTGRIKATSMSGDVRVRDVSGVVDATAMSGNVEVDFVRVAGEGDLSFTSMSGNVTLRLPADLDAEVSLKATTGDIDTDFPLEVRRKKYGPGVSADGRLGSGTRRLEAKSMSGNVSLLMAR